MHIFTPKMGNTYLAQCLVSFLITLWQSFLAIFPSKYFTTLRQFGLHFGLAGHQIGCHGQVDANVDQKTILAQLFTCRQGRKTPRPKGDGQQSKYT